MRSVEKRRACERLLQIAIQCVLDIWHLVAGLRLGLPAAEDDLLDKLDRARVLSPETSKALRAMKGFRKILVHEYGGIDDALVFKAATGRTEDFASLEREVLEILQKRSGPSVS